LSKRLIRDTDIYTKKEFGFNRMKTSNSVDFYKVYNMMHGQKKSYYPIVISEIK